MAKARAVVFDLDDTLYPYRQFLSSGFRAVAAEVERDYRLPAALVLRTLWRARREGSRGREIQYLSRVFDFPVSVTPALVAIMHAHTPVLRLPERSRRVLQALRADWRIGILTNGTPDIQARKVEALGIEPLVDAVVFARACGDGRGKPAREGFDTVLERLDTTASSAVFVGDDGSADIEGAAHVGMKTIHLLRGRRAGSKDASPPCCDATLTTLREVPLVASRLVAGGGSHVV